MVIEQRERQPGLGAKGESPPGHGASAWLARLTPLVDAYKAAGAKC
jgi:hypothetical protein